MSASREKKQRQGAAPSERALQAQQQQAAHKRKTIIYTVVGVIVAVLVAALLIWNTGFFQARAVAATVGDTKLTTAELSYYYHNARNTYYNYMSMLGGSTSNGPDDETIFDAEENTTLRDYFLENALSDAQQYLALYREALENNHTEADIKDQLDARIDSMKSTAASHGYSYAAYLRASYGPYMSADVFEKMTAQSLLAQLAYSEKTGELEESYTEDDLKDYYGKDDNADTLDTFEYSYLYFTPATVETKDKDGNDIDEETVNAEKEKALAEAKENAEAALEALKDGGSTADLAKQYGLAESAYADHTTAVGKSSISSVYQEKLLGLKEGESALVENSKSGYYVVTFHSRKLAEEPTKDVRHILATAEHTTGDDNKLVPPTEEAWAAAKAKMDEIQAAWDSSDKTEDAFAELANEKSDDGGSNTKGGLYKRVAQGEFVAELDEWLFDSARKSGDVNVIQHSAGEGATSGYYGYHLIYYVGDDEPVWMRTARKTLTEQDGNAWVEELSGNYPTALANGASYLGT